MVYLADWKSAVDNHETISGIRWYFDHFGPFVWDVVNLSQIDPAFESVDLPTLFGSRKTLIRLRVHFTPLLSRQARQICDHVIEHTADKSWSEFIKLVYSTYPVVTSSKYSWLDLPMLAAQYRAEMGGMASVSTPPSEVPHYYHRRA